MLTKEQATKAIKSGCRRANCNLVSTDFTDDSVTIMVNDESDRPTQIGREYGWQGQTPDDLSLRVARFSQHWVKQTPYHSTNPFKSI